VRDRDSAARVALGSGTETGLPERGLMVWDMYRAARERPYGVG
jgi:hypothetical protein